MPSRLKKAKSRPVPSPASPPRPVPVPARTGWLCALGVFVVVLAVYQATLLRTVVDIDSGELVAAVHVQGIPHPTGYPLWLLLGRLFDVLPFGHSSAYRVGLMNAVGVAGASAVITLLALDLTGQILPALFAGLAFGFWAPPWGDTVRAMVHALSGLLVALCLVALRRWDRRRTPKALLLFAFAVGVAAMHHRTAFLVAGPALAAAFVLTRPRRARTYLPALAASAAPFSLYGYLWYRALQHPPVYWTDITTFPRLWRHIMAQQYTQFAFEQTAEQAQRAVEKMVPQLLAGPGLLSVLMVIVGVGLIVWGWSVWWKRERLVAAGMAAGTVAVLIWVSKWGEASDLKHFLSPIGPPLALAGALGAAQLRSLRAVKQYPWAPAALVGVLICGGLFRTNVTEYNFSNRWGNRDRWASVLTQMAPHAIFVSDYDQPTFVTTYLQNVEKLRPDIILLRATRLDDRGYLGLLRDPEVRRAAEAIAFHARSEVGLHEEAARFAAELARRLPTRAVYAVHGPPNTMQGLASLPPSGPPYFLNLSMDFARVTMTPPDLLRKDAETSKVDFPNNASLISFALDKAQAGTGEMVGFTVRWRLVDPLPPSQFILALQPSAVSDPTQLPALVNNDNTRFFQPFLFCYGQWGLAPSPAGTVYEQRGSIIVPSNAPAGSYHIALAISLPLVEQADQYQDWVTLPATLEVKARPLPKNGP